MKREDETPAELMLSQALARADRVSPADGSSPRYEDSQALVEEIGHMTAAHLRLTAPMIRAFHNGGLPAKWAGKIVTVGWLKIPAEQFWTIATRVMLFAGLVTIIVLLLGGSVEWRRDGIRFERPVAATDPQGSP